jgi:Family of unknown function (DUF6644)
MKNTLLFPVIQSIHLIGIGLFVGTIVLADLRALQLALQRYAIPEIRQQLAPWNRAGLVIMLTTGPILFASDIPRYIHNSAFLLKMALLMLALLFDRSERQTKLAAFISIALWTCVVVGGRAIADFDIS